MPNLDPRHVADARAAAAHLDELVEHLGPDLVAAGVAEIRANTTSETAGPREMTARRMAQALPKCDPAHAMLAAADARWWAMAQRLDGQTPGMRWSIARQYTLPSEDPQACHSLIWCGYHRAAVRWDPDQGVPYRKYAALWASAEVRRARRGNSIVRHPDTYINAIMRAEKMRAEGMPDEEIRRACKISRQRWAQMNGCRRTEALGFADIAIDVDALARITTDCGEAAAGVVDQIALAEAAARVERRLRGLTQRQRHVIRQRAEGLTLREIGGHFGLSRERVRQIEREAREVLLASRSIRSLREAL